MHNDSMPRGMTRALVALLTAAALGACADDAPVAPKPNIPEGGVKSVALGVNILPAGQQFPDKIAFATGSPNGKAAYVQVYSRWGNQMLRFKAFTDTWDNGGVEVAVGDVTGDGWPDIIAGEGPALFSPSASRIAAWDGKTGAWLGVGYATGSWRGGLRVGAGDFDGDGKAEMFTCYGPGTQATQVDKWELHPNGVIGGTTTGWTLGTFTGKVTYNGCRVAGGDVNGDGKADMVVAFEGPSNTLWIHSNAAPWNALYPKPITPLYTGQISVAVGDVNKDGKAEVFLGRLTALDNKPPVLMYDGAKTIANGMLANGLLPTPAITYPMTNSIYNTGIYIAAHDLSGDGIPELLAKLSTTGGYSTYVARMGPNFTSHWLNQFEPPGTLPAGGPIS